MPRRVDVRRMGMAAPPLPRSDETGSARAARGERQARVERPGESLERTRCGVGHTLLDAADHALMEARRRGHLLLGEAELAAPVDDLLDQVETVAQRVHVRPACLAFGLDLLVDPLKKIVEVRHSTPILVVPR